MSVEDIDFLLEHSEKENFILYSDSSVRNKSLYPHPNSYTVKFEQPFKYVYGIDVLDGSIPSVSYNVGTALNSCSGWTYNLNPSGATGSASDGTYTFQSLLTELANFEVFDSVLNSKTIVTQLGGGAISYETGIVFVTSFDLVNAYLATVANTNNPNPSITNYESSGTGYWIFQRGFIQSAVIFNAADLLTFDSPTYEFTYGGVTYQIINDPANSTYQNLINIVQTYDVIVQTNADGSFNLVYYQWTEVPKSVIITFRTNQNTVMYLLDMTFFYATYRPGNYDVSTFLPTVAASFGGTGIAATTVTSSNPSIVPILFFNSPRPFVLNMDNSTARTIMGFDEYPNPDENVLYQKITYLGPSGEKFSLFGSTYNSTNQYWNLTAPGILYLLGVPYITLRCPEIESHLYASRAFGQFSPGIGMFKLYAVNDFSHQRFDFTNFAKKPFHPIGKLSQLTFTFQNTDGTLYDFKGANHIMMINIKYYVPTQKRKFTRSKLAPNYDYNFQSYLARHMDNKEKSDEEEDDDIDIHELKNKYILQEKKYDYSTSDSDNQEDDDLKTASQIMSLRR